MERLESTIKKDDITKLIVKLLRGRGYAHCADLFLSEQPIWYDEKGYWWVWERESNRWVGADETRILLLLKSVLSLIGDVTIKRRRELLEAIKQASRERKPKEWAKTWVQFKDRAYDVFEQREFPVSSEYFCANPIPWSLGDVGETPKIDELLESWVGSEKKMLLYELLAYCCVPDYPIHAVFCLLGCGSNGKSKFIKLLTRFLGSENVVSSDLGVLTDSASRFETFDMYKKLVVVMGETNYSTLRNTSMLKKLTGQDLIKYEAKGKQGFSDYNYAKVVIATNSLPTTTDTSEGFYRRWIIVDFPNQYEEGPCPVDNIPDSEFVALARKSVGILSRLLRECRFSGVGSIVERRLRYQHASNPIDVFLGEGYERHPDGRVRYSDVFNAYKRWLSARKRRIVTKKEFREALVQEGFDIGQARLHGVEYPVLCVLGLCEKERVVGSDGSEQVPLTVSEGVGTVGTVGTDSKQKPSLQELGVTIRELQNGSEPVEYARIQQKTGWDDKPLRDALNLLKERGDLYEPKKGYWGVLE